MTYKIDMSLKYYGISTSNYKHTIDVHSLKVFWCIPNLPHHYSSHTIHHFFFYCLLICLWFVSKCFKSYQICIHPMNLMFCHIRHTYSFSVSFDIRKVNFGLHIYAMTSKNNKKNTLHKNLIRLLDTFNNSIETWARGIKLIKKKTSITIIHLV